MLLWKKYGLCQTKKTTEYCMAFCPQITPINLRLHVLPSRLYNHVNVCSCLQQPPPVHRTRLTSPLCLAASDVTGAMNSDGDISGAVELCNWTLSVYRWSWLSFFLSSLSLSTPSRSPRRAGHGPNRCLGNAGGGHAWPPNKLQSWRERQREEGRKWE